MILEHFAGALPVWLAPVQAVLIPIADRHLEFSRRVEERMKQAGLRVEVDPRAERMNAKIRDAQLQKVPFMLIAGDREVQADSVAVRLRSGEDLGPLKVEEVIARLREAIQKGD
jgi:threonyl-tRNA synthetase